MVLITFQLFLDGFNFILFSWSDQFQKIFKIPIKYALHKITHLCFFFYFRPKRRATRAVRPTKRTEFTEADGQVEGKIVFQLEKESQHETFKIRDENPWVTVEPNGAVRVKKRWDYEELGREKTIDFWVIITNSGAAGKRLILFW